MKYKCENMPQSASIYSTLHYLQNIQLPLALFHVHMHDKSPLWATLHDGEESCTPLRWREPNLPKTSSAANRSCIMFVHRTFQFQPWSLIPPTPVSPPFCIFLSSFSFKAALYTSMSASSSFWCSSILVELGLYCSVPVRQINHNKHVFKATPKQLCCHKGTSITIRRK